jgi:hypothetical protein
MAKVPDVQVELVQHPWYKGTLQGKISNSIDPFPSFCGSPNQQQVFNHCRSASAWKRTFMG